MPLDRDGCVRINYLGPPGTVPVVPFHRVLAAARGGTQALVDQHGRPVDFRDAIVIVGATARSLGDRHATPYANGSWQLPRMDAAGLMAGPEVQANVVATLADGAYITTPWWLAPLPWVLAVGAALGGRLRPAQPDPRGDAGGGPPLRLEGAGPGRLRRRPLAGRGPGHDPGRRPGLRRRLRPPLAGRSGGCSAPSRARRSPGPWRTTRATCGSRARSASITVLFSDIRSFTSFSEAHTPREVVALLNAYFGAVVPAIEAEGGVVDKYIGDGIMALFGAPDALPDHALRAVRSAVAMVEKVHELAPAGRDLGFAGMRIGVGRAHRPGGGGHDRQPRAGWITRRSATRSTRRPDRVGEQAAGDRGPAQRLDLRGDPRGRAVEAGPGGRADLGQRQGQGPAHRPAPRRDFRPESRRGRPPAR